MVSLNDRIALLENDLKAKPPRISVYRDLPFAILRYDPQREWELRHQIGLLKARLESVGREVVVISLADLLWEAVEASEGLETLVDLERDRGYAVAQEQVTDYLSDPEWCPLPALLSARMQGLDPRKHIVFLTGAAAMAPAIYPMSRLLDEMQGRTQVMTILFYPGTIEGTTGLRFMALKERETLGNYRVKIYG
jgi:hypothetical protein